MRAHSIWLVAQGLRPYSDFFECHQPYFALLTPLARVYPHDACAFLGLLRLMSGVGNLLFLGGLAAVGARVARSGWLPALLGVTVVAFHPAVLGFLVEFRIDGWGCALAIWSIYRLRGPARGAYRYFEFGIVTGLATALFCPKLILLPPLVVLVELLGTWDSVRGGVRGLLAYSAGVAVAAGGSAMYLAWQRIDFDRTIEVIVRYNAQSNANLSFRYSLFERVVKIRLLPWLILGGLVARTASLVRERSWPDAYEAALALWLVIQVLLVAYPYKQYYAPWFLFASYFVVCLWGGLWDLSGRVRVVGVLVACAITVLSDFRAARSWSVGGDAQRQERLIRWMRRVTHAEDRVVAAPPLHPIDRRDSFFLWFNNFDPRGFDSETILARLPSFQGNVAAGRFRKELEEEPPALVVLSGDWRIVPYTSGQQKALIDFLERRGYVNVTVESARFAIRPDRFEDARRSGLLSAANAHS
jgi:hypothetical protein